MRTTVDIPDAIYRELKVKAATEGTSVKQLVLRGASLVLSSGNLPAAPRKRLSGPIDTSGVPGSVKLTNERIDELLFGS